MKNILFTNLGIKGVILATVLLLLVLNGFLFFKKNKNDNSIKRKAIQSYIVVFIIIFYATLYFPLDGFMNFNSVEEAFHFQNLEGKLLFKKNVGNTAFVHGLDVYKSETEYSFPGVFTFYIKNGDHWKTQYEANEYLKNCVILKSKKGKAYYLYNLYSNKDNITGIFIHTSYLDENFTKNAKISDSRNTVFEGFYGLPRSSNDTKEYMFLGIIEGKIDEKYYILIEDEKYYIKELMKSIKNRIE